MTEQNWAKNIPTGKFFSVKRNARSELILDSDDILILWLVQDKQAHSIIDIKGKMNFSHNALKIHISRLQELGLIKLERYTPDYKRKFIILTALGIKVFSDLLKSPKITNILKGRAFKIEIKKEQSKA